MRIIGHLDMDAFFAAVEERDHEWLAGRPVIVGADPKGGAGRGVVSTANYVARKYGIHSALPISRAWKLCQEAKRAGKSGCIFVEGDFRKYGEVSSSIMNILRKHCNNIEQASVDEAYFQIDLDSWDEAKKLAKKIKKDILEVERLTCSIGVGPNKLIAKIASDVNKPDGLTIVREEEVVKFLEPMAIRKIPGIGPKTESLFLKRGIKSVRDMKKLSPEELGNLYLRIRGVDESPLIESWEAKSIGEESTFEEDTKDANILMECIISLADNVFGRLKSDGFRTFKTIVLKIRFGNFETKTRSKTLSKPARDKLALKKEAMGLLLPFLDSRENPKRRAFRLLGLRVEKLK